MRTIWLKEINSENIIGSKNKCISNLNSKYWFFILLTEKKKNWYFKNIKNKKFINFLSNSLKSWFYDKYEWFDCLNLNLKNYYKKYKSYLEKQEKIKIWDIVINLNINWLRTKKSFKV